MSGIGDLVSHLVADTAQWTSGLNKAKSEISSFASDVSSMLGGVAASFASVLGANVSIAAAEGDIKATMKLQAVLDATGSTAGVTGAEIAAMASELEKATGIADDMTISAAAVLGTFKNIGGDNFKEVLGLAQDLSALKDMPLAAAVTALGKALNNPAEGFAALTRLGIQFTDEQERMITTLAKSGDVIGAQDAMLKILQGTFGGLAGKVQTDTEKLSIAIGNLSEHVGMVLLPFVAALAAVAVPFMAEWGHEIALVAVAVGTLITVLTAVTVAQKAIAIGQAAILALGGPAGWTALAIGAGVFAAAVVGIEVAFQGVASAAEEAAAAARDVGKAAEEWNFGEGQEFEGGNFGEGAEFGGGGEFGNWDAYQKKLRELTDELSILRGEATAAEVELQHMMDAGLEKDNAGTLQWKMDEVQREKDRIAKEKERQRDADAIRESVMTPDEKFHQEVTDLRGLRDAGALDEETFNRAIDKAREDAFGKDEASKTPGGVGAAQKGSSEQLSAVYQAMRGNDTIQQKQLSAQEETIVAVQGVQTAVEELASGGMGLVAGSLS